MEKKMGRIQLTCGIVILGSMLSKLILDLEFSELDRILVVFGFTFIIFGFLIMKKFPDEK
ncbi:MAG: hypothetical protein RR565_02270 [Erysipelothrix sp.]